jgi:hypothetical protein
MGLLIFLTCPRIVSQGTMGNSGYSGTGLTIEVKRTIRFGEVVSGPSYHGPTKHEMVNFAAWLGLKLRDIDIW